MHVCIPRSTHIYMHTCARGACVSPAGISGTRGHTVVSGLSDTCGVFLFCGYWSRASHACPHVCALWGREGVHAALMGGPCRSHMPGARPPAFTTSAPAWQGQLTQNHVLIEPATYKPRR